MDLMQYLEKTAEVVDKMIYRYFSNACDELGMASAHLLQAGGKRLRPAVVMLAADAVKQGSSGDLMSAALALELTHSFTLIHDDIMDGDSVRRGVATVHTKWDTPTAILAGDVLYASAFEFLAMSVAADQAKVRAVSMLARTCVEICEGQHLDMSFESRDDVTEGEYLGMVGKKTGALYAAAAAIGGMLAGGSPTYVDALYHYGYSTGMAFQIQDDLIDLQADSTKSGKDRASDLREGKQTLISIKAREMGFDLTPYRRDLSEEEVDDLIEQLNTLGVVDCVRKTAEDLVESGKKRLAVLPKSEERDLLNQIGDFFITRGF